MKNQFSGATALITKSKLNGFGNDDEATNAYSNDIVSLSGLACDRTSISVLDRVPSCQEVLMDSARASGGENSRGK